MFGPAGIGDSVRAVAERVGLSQRRFIEVFTAQVGLTLKLFCRILRLKQAWEFVDRAATLNWSQVALACGYDDQSQLIHDFQEFCGFSPTDYLSLPGNHFMQNHVRLLGQVNFLQDAGRPLRYCQGVEAHVSNGHSFGRPIVRGVPGREPTERATFEVSHSRGSTQQLTLPEPAS